MGRFKFNEPNLNEVLRGRTSLAYTLVSTMAQESESAAKEKAPRDTGELVRSITHVPPYVNGNNIRTTVKVGARHGMVVHQGRKEIVPVNKKYLSNYWKRIGRKTDPFTDSFAYYVRPRAGRPFLIEGMTQANGSLGGKFKIIVKRPWRTDGS